MKQLIAFALLIGALALMSGCRSIGGNGTHSEQEAMEEENAVEIAMGNKILKAIRDNNYPHFIAPMTDEMKTNITQKDFNTSREGIEKNFGKIVNSHFLTSLKTPAVKNLIWTVTFERKSSDKKTTITQQLLFRLVTGTIDGKVYVTSLGFL